MTFVRFLILALALSLPQLATSHEAPIRVAILGEDSDTNSVRRNNEIYKRVVSELQQSFIRENITVIDEDMLAVRLGFSYNVDRSRQELIQTLSVANDTADASVRTRLGIVFAIFPNIQELSMARKLTVRVRGQIYDLKTLRALSSFEVAAPETVTVPKSAADCNRLCVEEKAGELAVGLARELGAVLSQKLHILIEDRNFVDVTDSQAILDRLKSDDGRAQRLEKLQTEAGTYTLDTNRAFDIEVYFAFDSSELTARAQKQLNPLGRALESAVLARSRYLIAGHTDAKGSAAYNQSLSERRAASVVRYLLQSFAIDPKRLVPIGLGEARLKSPDEPNAGINRRVEISLIVSGSRERGSDTGTSSWDAKLESVYTLSFNLMSRSEILRAVQIMEARVVNEIELLKSTNTQRIYSVTTNKNLGQLEEEIMLLLMDLGVDVDQLRFSSFGTELTVEAL